MKRGLTNSAIKAQENYYNRLEIRGAEQQQPIRTTTTSDARFLLSPPPQPRQMVYHQSARNNNNIPSSVYVDTLSPHMHGASLPGVVSVPPSPQLVRIDEVLEKENQRPLGGPNNNQHHHHSRQLDLNSSSDMSSIDGPPMSLPLKHAQQQQLCKPTPFVVSSTGATLVNTYRYTQPTSEHNNNTNSPCLMRPMALRWSGSTGSSGTPGRALMHTLKCSPSARASASPRKHLRFEDSPVVKPIEAPNPILSPLGPILSNRTGGGSSSAQPPRSEVNRYFNVCAMSVADEDGRVTLAPHQKRSAERSSAEDIAAGCPRRALHPRTN